MTKRLFLDTACFAFAERSKDKEKHWEPHCARVSTILEDTDTGDEKRDSFLVEPEHWWLQTEAAFTYHQAHPFDFANDAVARVMAADALKEALEWANIVICHNAAFHKRIAEALLVDGGVKDAKAIDVIRNGLWFCTMAMSMPVLRLPTKNSSGYKPPNLGEAYHHFTGLWHIPSSNWRSFGDEQVTAVRAVYRGLQGNG